jgi:broad specificity phosphatase PhoE
MTTRHVLLLRHGRTAWNAERRFQGQADPPLDDVGRAQAYEVAAIIAALAPSVLVSSDAVRAVQTAERVATATGLSLRVEPRLRERSLGHWEGLTRDEVAERYPDEFADWVAGRDVSRRGGETRDQVAARALAAFGELNAVPVTVVVTHSATAMALCNALLGMDQALHVLGPLANCHWSELTADQQHGGALWRLRGHNLGAPGSVVPPPLRSGSDSDDAPDADA